MTLPAQVEWRYDRTGIYANETGLLKSWSPNGPELLWFYDGLGEGHSSVAIASEKLYITGMTDGKGYLYVFDFNGKLLNKVMYGDEWTKNYVGTRATPVINHGKIYLVSGTGNLICLDGKNLDVIWKRNILDDFESKNITWGINESPLIIEEKLIITPGGKEHNIVALDKNIGKLIWNSKGKGELSAYCSPLYIGDQKVPLIVTMTAHHILGLEAATGKLLWSFENRNRHQIHSNTPVYADNMVFCSSVDKGATMLRLSDGGRRAEIVWEIVEWDNMMGGVVKIGDYLFASSSGERAKFWYCVDWMTGEIKYRDRRLAMGVAIVADGMLYCYTDKGEMALVKPTPEKFDIVSQFPITKGTGTHWAHPVIYQGVLYVRHGDSLMAYKIK
jgi:outer membrane protein assembly factor BamB